MYTTLQDAAHVITPCYPARALERTPARPLACCGEKCAGLKGFTRSHQPRLRRPQPWTVSANRPAPSLPSQPGG
eukprot:7142628-Pyramimonas_sp.AAC.1